MPKAPPPRGRGGYNKKPAAPDPAKRAKTDVLLKKGGYTRLSEAPKSTVNAYKRRGQANKK